MILVRVIFNDNGQSFLMLVPQDSSVEVPQSITYPQRKTQ
jgi:hypothetical protein